MIHIENITINIQAPIAESGPTSALGDALLHAMAESLFAQQSEEGLDSEGEVQHPTNPPRMNSQQQRADAWMAESEVCGEHRQSNATSHRGAACGASGGLPGCASNGDTEK